MNLTYLLDVSVTCLFFLTMRVRIRDTCRHMRRPSADFGGTEMNYVFSNFFSH